MSGNGYGYYYPPNPQNMTAVNDPNQTWSSWSLEQQQYNEAYARSAAQQSQSANAFAAPRPQNFYNINNRHQQRRYNSAQSYHQNQSYNNWPRNNYNKRPHQPDANSDAGEAKSKSKKKKKPLSQNIPKREWSPQEAEMALNVEKEYNKRFKNHSLIIKFPDLELNRDIVTKFHPAIENVHFQQPSTPRFCFVTLQEWANADAVISALNKIPFGQGNLIAEYKKDREEDQNIGPEDIDPCTLYVGNLAQEVIKEDMVKIYPKGRRIDIGFAKKMKFTRYAFVTFKTVSDSIEAFKKTHSTQMYSKSLIVRFRRLHGTVGMPGESKTQLQSPVKSKNDSEQRNEGDGGQEKQSENQPTNSSVQETSEQVSASVHQSDDVSSSNVDLSVVKNEVDSSDDDLEEYQSPFMQGSLDLAFQQMRPMVKTDVKQEKQDKAVENSSIAENGSVVPVKQEADVKTEKDDSSEDEDECGGNDMNFSGLLNDIVNHSNRLEDLWRSVP